MIRWQKHITYNNLKSFEDRFSENKIFSPGKSVLLPIPEQNFKIK